MTKKPSTSPPPRSKPRQVPIRRKKRDATLPAPSMEPNLHRLLHELEVHQIELEMQNAELQNARNDSDIARERYSYLFDFAPIGYFALDQAGKIQMVNLSGAKLAGAARTRLVGQSFTQQMPLSLRPAFTEFLRQVFAVPGKHTIETEFASKGEKNRFVNIEAQCAPKAEQCLVVVVDVTKRKLAEERLRQNEALVTSLIQQAPFGVYVVDSKLQLQQVNAIAEPLLGPVVLDKPRSLENVLSAIWSKRVTHRIMSRFRHTLATGEPYRSPGFRERRQDTGEIEDYEWQIQRIALHAGENGVVAFFDNITSRKKAETAQRRLVALTATNLAMKEEIARRKAGEAALRKAKLEQARLLVKSTRQQAQLRELSRSLLTAQELERKRISRELHDVVVQSLVSISFQLTAIGKDPPGDDSKLKQRIQRAQELLLNSTEIVHSFARALRPTVLDDLGLVPALQTYMQSFMQDTGIRVSLNVPNGSDSIEGGVRTTIFRVAQAALTNIARHAKASQVTVTIDCQEDAVALEIVDDGKGFKTDTLSKAKKRGRLGLLGMRERVEMIGGTFSIDSQLGIGTTISASIPAQPEPKKPSRSKRTKPGKDSNASDIG